MGKIAVLLVGLFVAAIVLPEVRALMFVGVLCLSSGYMMGMQHRAKHDAVLSQARQARSVRTVEA